MKKILIPIVAALAIVGFLFQQGYGKELETLDNHSIDNALQRTNAGSISPDKNVYPVPWEDRSPLKQFKDGVDPHKIQCRKDLHLVIKAIDGSPACVKQETLQKLRERGWAEPLGNVVFQKPSEDIVIPDNAILQVVAEAPCAWMTLHDLPHSELLKRNDRTGRNALMLQINDDDLDKVPHLREMLSALQNVSGFQQSEYDKNAWAKRINSTEAEQQQIWDWLKETSDSQFGKRTDGSFTTYFTYKEEFYQIVWALC